MERTRSRSEPPETDLDYYARPENYTGSSLGSLTRFLVARQNEEQEPTENTVKNIKKDRSGRQWLLRRYRHILQPDMYEESSTTSSSSSSSLSPGSDHDQGSDDDQGSHVPHSSRTISHNMASSGRLKPTDMTCKADQTHGRPQVHSLHHPRPHTVNRERRRGRAESESGYLRRGHSDLELQQDKTTSSSCPGSRRGEWQLYNRDTQEDSSRSPMLYSNISGQSLTTASTAAGTFMCVSPTPSYVTREKRRNMASKYLHRFKRMALAVVNVLKLAKAIIKRTDSPSALLKTFTAMSREPETDDQSENMKSYGLHFDPSYFRTNKEISISSEVKAILRLPPSHRSPEQIQTAMFGLQSLPSFAEYPLHMQEKLTKVAWHEIVTPMRTIIRQGHFAENFYFILAGQAVVTIAKPGSTQTAAIMRRGTSFGELALLHHSRRTATVTSHDTVQLLSVGREDFFDIFMSGQGRGGVPEHIKFISQMDFMKDWPLERLLERPDQCLLHFFKRNMVIVKDSKISDWFYVVKSGSCQVLKQLKAVHGNLRPAGVQRSTYRTMSDRLGVGVWNRGLKKLHPGRAISWAMSSKAFHKKMNIASNLEHGLTTRTDSSSELTQQGDGPASGQSTGQQQQHQHHHQEQRPQQPVFVQIELLKPKDVFGLDLLNSNLDLNPPSVSLVSRGAECIMLSKAFFLRYANDQTRKRFSESIQPYPDEETMQESLQTKVNWQLYKHSLITEIIGQRHTVLTKQRLTSGL